MSTTIDEVDFSTPQITVRLVPREMNSFDQWDGLVMPPGVRRAYETLEEAVEDTAIVLDEHVPGWHDRITKPIEMFSVHDCVLGQVFGGLTVEPPPRRFFGLLDPSWRSQMLARVEERRCGYGRGIDFFEERGIEERTLVFSAPEAVPYWDAEVARRKTGGNA